MSRAPSTTPSRDLTGQVFGRLTVCEPDGRDKWGKWFWICSCTCGQLTRSLDNNLLRGASLSCGCLRTEKAVATAGSIAPGTALNLKPPGSVGFRQLLNQYKSNAKNRALSFELSDEQFKELTTLACHYCNSPPTQISYSTAARTQESRKRSAYVYNGVDRADNTKGYTVDNCVTCCGNCNKAKLDMSYQEFNEWIDRLALFRREKLLTVKLFGVTNKNKVPRFPTGLRIRQDV